jgi:hypothetical protein
MTAAVLTYNVPILPSPYDATLTNATQPGTSEMATGELNSTSVLNAVTYNWLHNAATANLYLEQQLGLFMPYNPSGGGSLIACPQGGVVSVKDNATGYTQFYVAFTNRPIGFADPSTDSTNFGLINFQNLVNDALPGTSIIWTGASAPAGYLQWPTAQTNISRATYSNLFAAIGTTWGVGNGSTTFGMPWAAAGSAVLHGITGISSSTNGSMISHSHSIPSLSVSGTTSGATTGGMSTNDPHTHPFSGANDGGINQGMTTFATPQGSSGYNNTRQNTGSITSVSINHSHNVPSESVSGTTGTGYTGTTGGTVNQAFGTTIMLCVKF